MTNILTPDEDAKWVLVTKTHLLLKLVTNNFQADGLTIREKALSDELSKLDDTQKSTELKRLQQQLYDL